MKTMSRSLAVWILIVVVVAVVAVTAYRWFDNHYRRGIATAVQHKSLKHSSGKVLSITPFSAEQGSGQTAQQYTLCFSVDSSAEISGEERSEYQASLNRPICRDVQAPAAAKLKPGERLAIGFLLENEGQISIARIETGDASIYP